MADTPLTRAIREIRGNLTPVEFAARIGVHPRSVYKFESGAYVPGPGVLCAIVDRCGGNLERLVRLAARAPRKASRPAPAPRRRRTG